jgi:hypothetical protein
VRGIAVLAASACVTAGGLTATASAQAANPSPSSPHRQAGTLPPAPPGARHGELRAAAASPGISPAARRTYHAKPGTPWNCDSGNLCVGVWDYSTGDWKAFDLYSCKEYHLSNWEDGGVFRNEQTGNVETIFYGKDHNVIRRFRSNSVKSGDQNWSPVWHIRNC